MAGATVFLRSSSIVVVFTLAVFAVQVNSQDAVKKHAKGYCVWYGQCTNDFKPLNCLYNGPAKKLTDPHGLEILHSRCPELRGQHTCCTTKQLEALTSNLQIYEMLTPRCPACWSNIRRLYCQLTCSQDQSVFMDVTRDELKYRTDDTIQEVDYYVAPEFKQGLFDSCKDVISLYKDVIVPEKVWKVLDFLCGTSAEKCTPQKLLAYMGSTSNGFAPFTINYKTKLAKNLSWMNDTIFKCSQEVVDPVTNRAANPCSCQDCAASCPVPPPPPPQPTYPTINSVFRTEQLIIRPTKIVPAGYHQYPYDNFIPFGPIFHLDLLNQALDLQNAITNMRVPYGENDIVTLQDICVQPFAPQTKECATQSVFQYFHNNKTKLNKCLTDNRKLCSPEILKFHFKAYDFHDHLLFCTSSPPLPDNRKLEEPCLGTYGGPISPDIVLRGFEGTAYQNASTLIITFVVNNYKDKSKLSKAMAWEDAFIQYMQDYVEDPKNGNLTISFSADSKVLGY